MAAECKNTIVIRVDDHVKLVDDRTGTVLFVGEVKFAKGEWYGISLDDPFVGKNDGKVRNKRYFTCRKNKGVFVKKEKIIETFEIGNNVISDPMVRAKSSPVKSLPKIKVSSLGGFEVGQRVTCDGRVGTVRFVGFLAFAPGKYLGVELDKKFRGKNNGEARGKRYFSCRPGQGIFVKPEKVVAVDEERKKDLDSRKHDGALKRKELVNRSSSSTPRPTLKSKKSPSSTPKASKVSTPKTKTSAPRQLKALPSSHSRSKSSRKVRPPGAPKTRLQISEEKRAVLVMKATNLERELEKVRAELRLTLANHEEEIGQARKQLEEAKKTAIEEIDQMKDALEGVEKVKNNAEEKCKALKDKLSKTDEQVRELQTSLTGMIVENKELSEIRSNLEYVIQEKDNEFGKVTRNKDNQLNNVTRKCDRKEKRLMEVTEELSVKKEHCTALEQDLQQTHDELTATREELEFQTKRVKEMEKNCAEMLRFKNMAEKQLCVAQVKAKDSETRLGQTAGKLRTAQVKILETETTLEDTRVQVEDVEKMLEEEKKRSQEKEALLKKKWKESQSRLLWTQKELELKKLDLEKVKGEVLQMNQKGKGSSKNRARKHGRSRSESPVDLFPQNHVMTRKRSSLEFHNQGSERHRRTSRTSSPRNSEASFSMNDAIINPDSSDSDFFDFGKGGSSDEPELYPRESGRDIKPATLKSRSLGITTPRRKRKLSSALAKKVRINLDKIHDEEKDNSSASRGKQGAYHLRNKTLPAKHTKQLFGLTPEQCTSTGDLLDNKLFQDFVDDEPVSLPPMSPRTPGHEEMTEKDRLDRELVKIGKKLVEMNSWIDETKEELSTLSSTPETFDEILATIEPERTRLVKQKFNELSQIAEKRKQLTEANETLIRESFQDRIWDLVARERECERNLKKVQKHSNDKIGMAAFQFKKNIPRCMSEYWDDAKSVRSVIEEAQRRLERDIPDGFETSQEARAAVKSAVKEEGQVNRLKDGISRLKRMGQILGKVKSTEALDCMYDSMDLEILQESISKKLAKRTDRIKTLCQERERESELKTYRNMDESHKAQYLEIMEWSDFELGQVMEFGSLRSPKEIADALEKLDRLLEVELPRRRESITSDMARTSTFLKEKRYNQHRLVKERETKLQTTLEQVVRTAHNTRRDIQRRSQS